MRTRRQARAASGGRIQALRLRAARALDRCFNPGSDGEGMRRPFEAFREVGGELLVWLRACFQPGRQRRHQVKRRRSADGAAQAAGCAGAAFACTVVVMGVICRRIVA